MSETKKLSNQDILYDLEQSNVRDDVFTQIKGIVEKYHGVKQEYLEQRKMLKKVFRILDDLTPEQMKQFEEAMIKPKQQAQTEEELVKIVKKAFDRYNSDVPEPILAEIRKLLGEK